MKQNELDKFIKGKMEEQSFEYNPADWENALKLIEKEDKKRRPLWIWWMAAGFLLALGASQFFSDSISTIDETEKITQKEIAPITNSNKSLKDEGEIINNNELQEVQEVQKEEPLVSQVERSASNDSDFVTVQKEVIPKITSPETGIINLPDPISGNNPKLQPISSPASESVADVRSGEDFISSPTNTGEKIESTSEMLPLNKFYDSQSIMLLASLDRKGEDHYQPQLYEWETPKLPVKIKPLTPTEVKLGFGYGVSGYINPYVGNLDGESKEITGFSGGLSALYRLDRTFSINADLLYTYRTGTFDKSNLSETKRYSFEALDGVTALYPQALHYVSVPLYAGLHFGKHRLTVGGSINYLGGVRGDVIDQTIGSGGLVIDESTQTGWIAKDGFTDFNIGGMIGYDYFVTNRWSLSFRSNYLFSNIVDQTLAERIDSFIIKENSQVNIQIGSTYYFK